MLKFITYCVRILLNNVKNCAQMLVNILSSVLYALAGVKELIKAY